MEAQNIPLQIISIDNEQNQFQLDEKLFKSVLRKIPPNMKVAIVSVVGAFRTGKSFLLDFFLRYLRLPQDEAGEIAWEQMFASGEKLEGNINASSFHKTEEKDDDEKEVNNIDNNNKDNNHSNGFSWRAGRDTNTTGIWVWSEPFVRKISTGEEVAVLLVDTQGMFDNTLSQLLTTSIFGLSTLLSSYQVYNVKFQIQEDQLQHLSLFAEYGRVALQEGEESSDNENETPSSSKPTSRPPFQTLQFLVRDWNEFEDLEQKDLDDMKTLEASMTEYLTHVLATNEKSNDDLVSVRKHIKDCFETVDAFLLPHPGFEVIKKNYDGK
jgi:atlastin